MRSLAFAAMGSLLLAGPASAQPDKDKLAGQAQKVFQRFCHECHPGEGGEAFDTLKRDSLLVKLDGYDKPLVTPGKPDDSALWKDWVGKGLMPRRGSRQASDFRPEDKEVIKAWIAAGAPDFPKEKPRDHIPFTDVLNAIKSDLDKTPKNDRKFLRYFTLTHLHNNPNVSGEQLLLTRAALAKVLWSLSWESQIDPNVPRAVAGTAETVFAIRLDKLGWDEGTWLAILDQYPYGLGYNNLQDPTLKELDDDIFGLSNEDVIHVRADWFVATASRPPLYHTLLYDDYLPELKGRESDAKNLANPKKMTARDLEHYLKIDVLGNIFGENPRARRAAFAKSGVSGQNRLIERHPMKGPGAYWKSYDFKASTWEANLLQFPLGPQFEKNPYKQLAFIHDGGEMIFNLPNGLQAYLLTDGKDNRIDAGPIEVVRDKDMISGTPAIVNGLSCMWCHKNGMFDPPADQVREGAPVFGRARDRVLELYPAKADFDKLVKQDADWYILAAEKSYGPMLRAPSEKGKAFRELPEPVGEVARRYVNDDMDAATVAAELYLPNPARLKSKLEDEDSDLRRLGLGALSKDGGTIKRAAWEGSRGQSQMQKAAVVFGYNPRNKRR